MGLRHPSPLPITARLGGCPVLRGGVLLPGFHTICSGDPGRDLTKLGGGGGRPRGVPPHPWLWGFSSCRRFSTPRGTEVPVLLPEGQILGTLSHVGACWLPPRLSPPGLCLD